MQNNSIITEKSEILFLYESTYSIPNGDPFTGEQRIDETTRKILVSDVRIKRFIRDHLAREDENAISVLNDESLKTGKTKMTAKEKKKEAAEGEEDAESGEGESESVAKKKAETMAAARFTNLKETPFNKKLEGDELKAAFRELLDVRMFGGVLSKVGSAINVTGPVQFAMLNPSLNTVDLRMHQVTSVFSSSTDKSRGAIGTTTVVPYALLQIHGWINPLSAKDTGLTNEDVQKMFAALWHSINNANTRSKSNQDSLLLLQIVYGDANKKIYGLDRLIDLKAKDNKNSDELRSIDDYDLDFAKLQTAVTDPKVAEVRYHTENTTLETKFRAMDKFKPMEWK